MAVSTEVPGRFDVGIGGRGFMLDEQGEQPALVWQSIRQQREQSGGANANIGEQTVNPEGFWRRSRDGWHHGAGQTYGDRDESDPLRFRASQGVDVFGTRHQATLLHKSTLAYSFAVAQGEVLLAGSRVYVNDVNAIKFVTAPLTVPWTVTTVTGTVAASTPRGLATDGSTVYIACNAAGIYTTTTSSSVAASFITGSITHVFYVKGRLLAVFANRLFNPVAAGALPSSLLDLAADWVWVDAAGGPQFIYLLATNGSRSVIYKTTIKADGTALDVPTVAGELVDAQQHGIALYGYAGRIFVATQTGVQMAEIDDGGNLIFGSRVPLASPSYGSYGAFVGDDRFVWYPNPNPTLGDGLSRLDLTVETLPNTPAYANDIRETSQLGQVRDINSIITYEDKRIFVAAAVGAGGTDAYVESDEYVDSGYIDSGLLALDLADAKTPVALDVEAAYPDDSSITEALSINRGASFTTVDTFDDDDQDEAPISGIAASRNFELRTTLTASTDNADTPVLYRHTLKAEPNVSQGDYVIMRLRLFDSVVDNTGSGTGRTPNDDIEYLQGLQRTREVLDLQAGSLTYTATLRDLDISAETRSASADDGSWNSVAVARFKVVTTV